MADVATLARVSTATVSFVLNDRPDQSISEATRTRVREAAATLQYRRNHSAVGLRTARTATIGFASNDIGIGPFGGATILGAEQVARENQHMLLVVSGARDGPMLNDAIELLISRSVEAIIFAVVEPREIVVPNSLKDVPAVLINGLTDTGWARSVLSDEFAGGRAATDILLRRGHRRIAYLTGNAGVWATEKRLLGFRHALAEAGVRADDQVVLHGNYRPDSGYDLTRQLLANGRPPTAIMCGNDRMATGAYMALAQAGLRIPEDVSVVGYDDEAALGEFFRPALTTVRIPFLEMGRWAARQVLPGKVDPVMDRTFLPCEPVERGSVAAPRVHDP